MLFLCLGLFGFFPVVGLDDLGRPAEDGRLGRVEAAQVRFIQPLSAAKQQYVQQKQQRPLAKDEIFIRKSLISIKLAFR